MKTAHCGLVFILAIWLGGGLLAPAQNCLTPPSGLAHWWRGEGNAFDTISVQDGILLGGVQFTNGKVGTGFLISGSGDDFIALPQNLFPMPSSGAGNSPFSFEVWFQTAAGGVILGQQDLAPFNSTLGGYVPALYVGTNGLLYAQMFWGTDTQLVTTNQVNDGFFHHTVVTYNGATEILYLDGAAVGTNAFTQQGYAALYYYQLGTGYTGGWDGAPGQWFPFAGVLDDVSLYSRALLASEVAALFASGSAGKCAPPGAGLVLRHRYSFDGEPGAVAVIDSIRGANGSLVFGSADPPYTNGTPDSSGFSGNGTLNLAGTSGCVSLPPRLLSVLSNFTVEAWITWNGPSTSTWQRVFDFGFSDRGTNADGIGTNYIIFTPARGSSGLPGFEETTVNPFGTLTDAESLILTGPTPLPIGEEVYIAVSYNPLTNSTRLYINGTLTASSTAAVNPSAHFTDYTDWLGRSQWHRDPSFNGSFDEFRIWEGVLTDQDVASHAAAGPNQQFVTSRPALVIVRDAVGVLLAWPAAGTAGFQLQTMQTLAPPSWASVTNGIILTNGNYQLRVPPTTKPSFYRLKQ